MLSVRGIEPESIVDGPGFRYVIFCQGCPHNCPGCHNPETHPFEGGRPLPEEEVMEALHNDPIVRGVTFSGGEPFCQAADYASLGRRVKAEGYSVMTYTGFTYEQLKAKDDPDINALLEVTDILVDGPFILAQRDLELRFRGSRNQRVLKLEGGKIVGTLED